MVVAQGNGGERAGHRDLVVVQVDFAARAGVHFGVVARDVDDVAEAAGRRACLGEDQVGAGPGEAAGGAGAGQRVLVVDEVQGAAQHQSAGHVGAVVGVGAVCRRVSGADRGPGAGRAQLEVRDGAGVKSERAGGEGGADAVAGGQVTAAVDRHRAGHRARTAQDTGVVNREITNGDTAVDRELAAVDGRRAGIGVADCVESHGPRSRLEEAGVITAVVKLGIHRAGIHENVAGGADGLKKAGAGDGAAGHVQVADLSVGGEVERAAVDLQNAADCVTDPDGQGARLQVDPVAGDALDGVERQFAGARLDDVGVLGPGDVARKGARGGLIEDHRGDVARADGSRQARRVALQGSV